MRSLIFKNDSGNGHIFNVLSSLLLKVFTLSKIASEQQDISLNESSVHHRTLWALRQGTSFFSAVVQWHLSWHHTFHLLLKHGDLYQEPSPSTFLTQSHTYSTTTAFLPIRTAERSQKSPYHIMFDIQMTCAASSFSMSVSNLLAYFCNTYVILLAFHCRIILILPVSHLPKGFW